MKNSSTAVGKLSAAIPLTLNMTLTVLKDFPTISVRFYFRPLKALSIFLFLIVLKRCYFVFFRAQIQRKEIVRCKRLGRWSDIYISSDRFLPRAFIPFLRSFDAYFLVQFLPSFLPSFDFNYLILRPTDQHCFYPYFQVFMVEGGRQRKL